MTSRVVVIHKVADYARWKGHFDAAVDLRVAAGEIDFEVLRAAHDPNLVLHIATWSSLIDAQDFFESAEVETIRRTAGVESPTFLYLTTEDTGAHARGADLPLTADPPLTANSSEDL